MSTPSVARKRMRTDEEQTQTNHENEGCPDGNKPPDRDIGSDIKNGVFTRDSDFWFDNGTAILIARDVEFRVYQGILADHSPVLKKRFAKTVGLRTFPMVNGQPDLPCPVVQLSDSPEDLRHVLRACMPRQNDRLYVTKDMKPSFATISASIRLGRKYQIAHLYQQALEFLKDHYTTDLDTWHELDEWQPPGWAKAEVIGVVNLARLTGERTLLPTAFLCCVQLGSALVHGFTHEDGSQENLTLDDLGLCFEAKSRLGTRSVAATLRTFSRTVSDGCKRHERCREALGGAIQILEASVGDLIEGDPLAHYTTFTLGNALGVCIACMDMIRLRNDKERTDLWNQLPEVIGVDVPGWGQVAPQ